MAYEHEKMAAEKAYYATQPAQGYAVPAPSEPTLSTRLKETLGYLAETAEIQRSIRLSLVGPEPTDVSPVGGLSKNSIEPAIEQLLSEVCQRAAMLASEARSIKNRL